MMLKFKLYGLIIIGIATTSFNNEVTWKLEKSKDKIQVYSYKPVDQDLKELKSHTKIKTSLSALISVLTDVEHYSNWIYKCSKSKKIKQLDYNKMVYYTISDAPWPVVDRELYAVNRFYQNEKTKVVYSISKPLPNNDIPPAKGLVRINDFFGKWKFTPVGNGEVEVDYFLKVDPAGSLPDWLVNMTLEMGPYQTLMNFKKEVLKAENQSAKFDFIDEPKD